MRDYFWPVFSGCRNQEWGLMGRLRPERILLESKEFPSPHSGFNQQDSHASPPQSIISERTHRGSQRPNGSWCPMQLKIDTNWVSYMWHWLHWHDCFKSIHSLIFCPQSRTLHLTLFTGEWGERKERIRTECSNQRIMNLFKMIQKRKI